MKALIIVGILLMLLGGVLMVKGFLTVENEHEANILGAKVSVTEHERRKIPLALSGTVLGVGAVLTVLGAAKSRKS